MEQFVADLLSLFRQHQRLIDLAIQAKSSKAKKVEGLTQVKSKSCHSLPNMPLLKIQHGNMRCSRHGCMSGISVSADLCC